MNVLEDRTETMDRLAARRAEEEGVDVDTQIEQAAEPALRDSTDDDTTADLALVAADEALRAARAVHAEVVGEREKAPVLEDRVKDAIGALYEGDTEGATKALTALVRPDAKAIAAEIRETQEREKALTRFQSEFPEIIADPYLADLADQAYLAAKRIGRPDADAIHDAGIQTRHWLRAKGAELGIVRREREPEAAANEDHASGVIAEMAKSRPGMRR